MILFSFTELLFSLERFIDTFCLFNSLVFGSKGEVILKDIKHHGHLGENEHTVFALVQFSKQLVKYL